MSDWQIAIETSTSRGSLSLLYQDQRIGQRILPQTARTAQTFGPALSSLLEVLRQEGGGLGWVSVGIGPGSFTGLRIAVAAAKTLAYASGCPVVPCSSLAAMLLQLREIAPEAHTWDVAMDAYRDEVFALRFDRSMKTVPRAELLSRDRWWQSLGEMPLAAAGDVWRKVGPPPSQVHLVSEEYWFPTADAIGGLGWQGWCQGACIDPMQLVPEYLRESAAVEKWQSHQSTAHQ